MAVLKVTNAAVGFLLEIALLAAFVVWGLALDAPWPVRIAAAALAPAAVGLLWASVLAPGATRRLQMPWVVLVKAALYGLAALALTHADHLGWAIILFGTAVVSLVLAVLWRQEEMVTH